MAKSLVRKCHATFDYDKLTTVRQNYAGLRDLEQLNSEDNVLVDSSTLCAMMHGRMGKHDCASSGIVRKLRSRIFPRKENVHEVIVYGEFVKMTMSDVKAVFGNICSVPSGVVRVESVVKGGSMKKNLCK